MMHIFSDAVSSCRVHSGAVRAEACTANRLAAQSAQAQDVALSWVGILNSYCDKALIPLDYTDILHSWGPF